MEQSLLPLFPLEVVLLPEEPLPLHIFEERYKEMIGECLKAKASGGGQQEFGVVLAKGQEIYDVGCTARIVNLTRQYADGRMDILTVGKRR
jgi:Lon protease-like protein